MVGGVVHQKDGILAPVGILHLQEPDQMLHEKDEMLGVDVCLGIREPDVPELVDGRDNGESRNYLFGNLLGAATPFHPRLSLVVREI